MVTWEELGVLKDVASFYFETMDVSEPDDKVLKYLQELEVKIDQIILGQSQIIAAINKLPDMVERVVHAALVDQNYSYLNSHFSAFMVLKDKKSRESYVLDNFARLRELFEYVVDFENRIDGLLRLMKASEQMYVMMVYSPNGILLMREKFEIKTKELKHYWFDILGERLVDYSSDFKNKYLIHRYILSENYRRGMKYSDLKIIWRENWVRDCLKPNESDFEEIPMYSAKLEDKWHEDGSALSDELKSTWDCRYPNVEISGPAFKQRFNRIKAAVNDVIQESVEVTKSYEAHRALYQKVFVPYLKKLQGQHEVH